MIRALFNDSPFVVAYGCFVVAAALVLIYAVTLYRQAHKSIPRRNIALLVVTNIALLVVSAVWVAIGIPLNSKSLHGWSRAIKVLMSSAQMSACFP